MVECGEMAPFRSSVLALDREVGRQSLQGHLLPPLVYRRQRNAGKPSGEEQKTKGSNFSLGGISESRRDSGTPQCHMSCLLELGTTRSCAPHPAFPEARHLPRHLSTSSPGCLTSASEQAKWNPTKPNRKQILPSKDPTDFLFFFCLFRAASGAYGSFHARGWIGATAAGLPQSHSKAGSEPHLWPTPQLMAMLDLEFTERGQGLNLHPHGY